MFFRLIVVRSPPDLYEYIPFIFSSPFLLIFGSRVLKLLCRPHNLLKINSSYDSNVENTSKLELIIQKLELIFAKGSVSQDRSRPMVFINNNSGFGRNFGR